MVETAALDLGLGTDEGDHLDVGEGIVLRAHILIVGGVGIAAPPALAQFFFHILHRDLLCGFVAGDGHRHQACTLGLVMGYQVDILVAGIDHRLKDVVQVIHIGILIHVEMAGLGLADGIGSNTVPNRRANHDLLFLLQLPQAAGDHQRVSAAGGVLGVVLHRANRDHKGNFAVHCVLDLVVKHFKHLHNSFLL